MGNHAAHGIGGVCVAVAVAVGAARVAEGADVAVAVGPTGAGDGVAASVGVADGNGVCATVGDPVAAAVGAPAVGGPAGVGARGPGVASMRVARNHPAFAKHVTVGGVEPQGFARRSDPENPPSKDNPSGATRKVE